MRNSLPENSARHVLDSPAQLANSDRDTPKISGAWVNSESYIITLSQKHDHNLTQTYHDVGG